jgi:hypothetical protein
MPDAPERRRLGGTPFAIAPLMLGTNAFGWTADEATSFALLDRFVAAGFNAIDTADVYFKFAPGNKGGESETIIGNWIAQGGGRRDSIMLATKFGMEMEPGEKGLSRDYMMRAVEASLRRLRTDRIDLYQSHHPDESTPIEETLRGYEELIARKRSTPAPPRACRATRRSSPGTISTTARIMRKGRSGSAKRAGSASSPSSGWRADSSPANTARKRIWKGDRGPIGSRITSTRAASESWRRSTRSAPSSARRRRRSLWPG